MKYIWSVHALRDRLTQRSGLNRATIEDALHARRCVIWKKWNGQMQEQHLIWDQLHQHFIAIPIHSVSEGKSIIHTVLPVNEKSAYPDWVWAKAMRAWFSDRYYRGANYDSSQVLEIAEVWLSRTIGDNIQPRGHLDLCPLFSWFLCEHWLCEPGKLGIRALLREPLFCDAVQEIAQSYANRIPRMVSRDQASIHIFKQDGTNALVPFSFFL